MSHHPGRAGERLIASACMSWRRRIASMALLAVASSASADTASAAVELGVMDAVERALRDSPSIQLQRIEVQLADGRALEIEGQLDPIVGFRASLQRLDEELTQRARQAEIDRRDQIADTIDLLEQQRRDAEERLAVARAVAADPENFRFTDPDAQAQLDLLNTLIADAENPQTRTEIERLRQQALQQQVDTAEATALDFTAREARERERLALLGEVPESEVSHQISLGIELRRPFRSGRSLTLFSDLDVSGFNFKDKPKDADRGGSGALDLYRSRIGFRIAAPLAAGRGGPGSEIDASAEGAAAAAWALRYQSSALIADVIHRYWQLATLQEREAILHDSLQRQRQLQRLTRALVLGDLLPAQDAGLADAAVFQSESTLLAARRARVDAQVALAQAVGLDGEAELPLAADLPPALLSASGLDALLQPEAWTQIARRRSDVLAALARQSAEGLRLLQARTDTAARSDLSLELFYSGVDEGSRIGEQLQGAFLGRWTGPSLRIAWSWERPLGLVAARARLQQADLSSQAAALALEETRREVARSLQQYVEQLQASVLESGLRRQAVDAWQNAVDAGRARLAGGVGTVIDLLQTEDRLTASLLDASIARYRAASEIVSLRHAADALLESTAAGELALTADALHRVDGRLLLEADPPGASR